MVIGAKSVAILVVIALLQFAIYVLFLKPITSTWGASKKEIAIPLAGDDLAPFIVSTRAITINAPKADVWKWLIQLGADRGGFYSYSFLERLGGYKTKTREIIRPEFKELKVGDIVRGSIDTEISLIVFEFPVRYVEPERTFVLENWGTFLLQEISANQTRLIVRTQNIEPSKIWRTVIRYIGLPHHYIMERRMLMGIKERVEAGEGVHLSPITDILWFSGIVLSGFGIFILILIDRGIQPFLLLLAFSFYGSQHCLFLGLYLYIVSACSFLCLLP